MYGSVLHVIYVWPPLQGTVFFRASGEYALLESSPLHMTGLAGELRMTSVGAPIRCRRLSRVEQPRLRQANYEQQGQRPYWQRPLVALRRQVTRPQWSRGQRTLREEAVGAL